MLDAYPYEKNASEDSWDFIFLEYVPYEYTVREQGT